MDKFAMDRRDHIVDLIKDATQGDLRGREITISAKPQTTVSITTDVIDVGFGPGLSGAVLLGKLLKELKVVGNVTDPIFFLNDDNTSHLEIVGSVDETEVINYHYKIRLFNL